MKRPFHEMSDREKQQVAEELMMQPTAFGILVIAAAMVLVVFLWSPIPDMIASASNATAAQERTASLGDRPANSQLSSAPLASN
jgi:hypothetical protein